MDDAEGKVSSGGGSGEEADDGNGVAGVGVWGAGGICGSNEQDDDGDEVEA